MSKLIVIFLGEKIYKYMCRNLKLLFLFSFKSCLRGHLQTTVGYPRMIPSPIFLMSDRGYQTMFENKIMSNFLETVRMYACLDCMSFFIQIMSSIEEEFI
jgi:hypothetical protein